MVAYSLMFGAIISSGIMWPLIAQREGQWYESGLQSQDFRGLFGYKVCLKHGGRRPVLPHWQQQRST